MNALKIVIIPDLVHKSPYFFLQKGDVYIGYVPISIKILYLRKIVYLVFWSVTIIIILGDLNKHILKKQTNKMPMSHIAHLRNSSNQDMILPKRWLGEKTDVLFRILCAMYRWNWSSSFWEEDLKFLNCIFCDFRIIALWKMPWSSICFQRMFCAMIGWNWSSGSGKEDENVQGLQIEGRTDGQTDDRRSGSLGSTWAKNTYCLINIKSAFNIICLNYVIDEKKKETNKITTCIMRVYLFSRSFFNVLKKMWAICLLDFIHNFFKSMFALAGYDNFYQKIEYQILARHILSDFLKWYSKTCYIPAGGFDNVAFSDVLKIWNF